MRLLAAIGFLAVVAIVGAGIYFLGGYYSVATTWEDPAIVKLALVQVRSASVRAQAKAVASQAADDPALVQRGAQAFLARGCVNCHGAPGVGWAKFAEGLNPGPADLKEIAGARAPREIFWVIKNGIRMTGMPGFAAAGVDDAEIWAITAFVTKLPSVTDDAFKTWTATPARPGG